RKQRAVSNFGLRRGHGKGSLLASYAAAVGGALSTSFVKAGELFGIELSGTMAHLHVMLFGSPEHEEIAFPTYGDAFPDSAVFLVDTYDTLEAVRRKVIPVAQRLHAAGHQVIGVRLDSGDLVSLSKAVRKILDEAGLDYIKIAASNDLD